jgi:hypothetical protein
MTDESDQPVGGDAAEASYPFDNRIAPRDADPDPWHFFEEMLRGAYDHGTILLWHEYELHALGERGRNVWRVERRTTSGGTDADADTESVAVLNLGAIPTLTALRERLVHLRVAATRS